MTSQPSVKRLSVFSILWRFVLLAFVGFATFFIISIGGIDPYGNWRSGHQYMVVAGLWFTGIMLLVVFLLTRFDRSSLRHAGLGSWWTAAVHFVLGLLLWFVPFSLSTVLGGFSWQVQPNSVWAGPWLAAILLESAGILFFFILPGLLVVYGYLLGLLSQYGRPWLQIALLSAVVALPPWLASGSPGAFLVVFAGGCAAGGLRLASGTIWLPAGFMVALLGIANHLKVQQTPFSLDPFVATALVTVVLPCGAVAAVLLSQLLSAGRRASALPPAVGSGS